LSKVNNEIIKLTQLSKFHVPNNKPNIVIVLLITIFFKFFYFKKKKVIYTLGLEKVG